MNISLAVTSLLITTIVLQAQQGSHTIACDPSCVNTKHKYTFCTMNLAGGFSEYKDICVENPHATTDPGTGQPIKHYHPSLDNSGFIRCKSFRASTNYLYTSDNVHGRIGFSPTGTDFNEVVFTPDPALMRSNLESAMRAWTQCCDKDGQKLQYTSTSWPPPPDGCCITVYWSSDEGLFEVNGSTEPALAVTKRPGKSANSCDGVICDPDYKKGPVIILNQSDKFKRGIKDNIPDRFFYNTSLSNAALTQMKARDFEYYDFISVLVHEIGHVFGIAHDNGPDDNGNNCEDDPSVMSSSLSAWTLNRQVSSSDCCRFRKIYCCAETVTSIIDETGQLHDGDAMLCGNCGESNQLIDLKLYDMSGRLLDVYKLPSQMMLSQIGTYVHADAGVYVCVVQLASSIRTFKILVAK